MTSVLRLVALWSLTLLLSAPSLSVQASDLYRVELLLFERTGPDAARENLGHQPAPSLPDRGLPLWVDTNWQPLPETALPDSTGAPIEERPQIIALPSEGLRLSRVADQIQRENGYRVLAFTAWEEYFPHGYHTAPLVVDLRSETNGSQAVRGSLTIERRRYLHVRSDLYHLELDRDALLDRALEGHNFFHRLTREPRPAPELPAIHPALKEIEIDEETPWKVRTWLRELRRMRSGEVHYLDSPSLGLVVYFDRIERDEEEDPDNND